MVVAVPVLFAIALVWLLARARRFAGVLVLLAALAVVPFAPAFVQPATFGGGVVQRVEEDPVTGEMRFVDVEEQGVDLIVALLAYWLVLGNALTIARLPARFRKLEQLPEVAGGVVPRFAQWVRQLGLRPVPLREERSEAGMQVQAKAIVGLSPFIVASDGALYRFDPHERDALLAHELGHVARRHPPRLFAVLAIVGAVAVQVSGVVALPVALLWLFAAQILARMVFAYGEELAADRFGAQLAGAVPMVRALDKTHAATGQLGASPWLYALVTHPHLAVRAAAIRRRAADADAAAIEVDAELVRRCTLARRCGLAVAGAVLGGSVLVDRAGFPALACVLLAALAVAPTASMIALQPWQNLRDAWRLGLAQGWQTLRVRLGFLLAAIAAAIAAVSVGENAGAGFALAAIVSFVTALQWGRAERRARHRLAERLQQRDLRNWLAEYDTLPPRFRTRPDLWNTATDVRFALGERERAEAECERLLARWPRFHFARIARIARLRGRDPAAAVPLARELVRLLPDHPSAIATIASVLRSVGQLDEAWELASRARRMRPRAGLYHAIAARIATARGDLPAAREALAEAWRLEPGDARTLVAQADLECAERSPTAAQAIERARDVVGRTLFSYLEPDVAALQAPG